MIERLKPTKTVPVKLGQAHTVVTGIVDAASFLNLGRVFVANMTGNVVFVGFAMAGAGGLSLWASLLALGAFLAGSLAGGRLCDRYRAHRGRTLRAAVVIELVAVASAAGLAAVIGDPAGNATRYALIALLAPAMGIQNATVRRLAVPELTTTVLTMTMAGIAADSRFAGGLPSVPPFGLSLSDATTDDLDQIIGGRTPSAGNHCSTSESEFSLSRLTNGRRVRY